MCARQGHALGTGATTLGGMSIRRTTLSLAIAAATAMGCGGPGVGPTPAGTGPRALPAGPYQSEAFAPRVAFTLPDGWWIPGDAPDYLGLQPVASGLVGIHLFRNPRAASQDAACPETPEPGVGDLDTDLLAWIRARPGLDTSNPRIVTVGGVRGLELDVAIAQGWKESCPFANGAPTVPLFVGGSYRWVVAGNERLRLTLLYVADGTVVVDVDAFDGTLMDDLVARAQPIVQSLSFAKP
jgi:hypothetical protein